MKATTNRREFLQNSSGVLGGVGALLAMTPETSRGFQANDTLNIGCIGTGGRCQHLMRSLAAIPGVRIAAVCDIYEPNRVAASKLADKDVVVFTDYRALLDAKTWTRS